MRRPGLLLPLFVVGMWVLLFFLLDYRAARTGGPPWAWRRGARVDAKEGFHATR